MRAIKLLAALPVILALLIPLTAHAIDQPDNSDLIQASNAYTFLLEKGDLLVVTEYDIQYATTPTDYRSDEAFFIQLLDSGTTIGVNTLYPYFESGYQEGVASRNAQPRANEQRRGVGELGTGDVQLAHRRQSDRVGYGSFGFAKPHN
jgi:hypothetical protein